MPYCPKCDMEFVEGVQVCSDCGGKLFATPEEARAFQQEEEKKAMEEFLSQIKEDGFSLEEEEISEEDIQEKLLSASNQVKNPRFLPPSVYVKKSERYQEMKSSASAFLFIGGLTLLLSVLIFIRIIPLPGSNRISFGGLLGIMGLACMAVCLKTKKEAAGMKVEADKENKEMQELISWFLQQHTAEEIDRKLTEEQTQEKGEESSPEEISLKRFSLIQDYLAVEKDLPDQAYIEALSEEIYAKLWRDEE